MKLAPSLLLAVLLAGAPLAGCKGSSSGGDGATNLPAKGPWETLKLTYVGKQGDRQVWTAENVGNKKVNTIFFDFYGYDAKGNQVAKKDLSWNLPIAPGKSEKVDTADDPKATQWDITYHGIGREGESLVTDDKRSPAKKAKGHLPSSSSHAPA